MKKLFCFLFPIIFFSACSDFQHVHYSKLKKVPATGFVAPLEIKYKSQRSQKENQINANEFQKYDSFVSENPILKIESLEQKGSENKFNTKNAIKEKKHIALKKVSTNQLHKNQKQKRIGEGFLIFMLIVLFLTLIILGGIVFVMGIFAGIWWAILIGLALIFLGGFPLVGFVGFIVGDRNRPMPAKIKEEK
ncbi:MAG: hypothetical protein NT084_09280 [Bacteroidetes bacterium]|nr:hypothetical protein [Bacteroidota bacterium]